MRRILICALLLLLGCASFAQTEADTPASKEDVQRYLETMHSHQMMRDMVIAMSKPMHQMAHEQCENNKGKLPADCEARMNKMMDQMMNEFPWDELLDAQVPIYQKYLTKGDIDALVAFYSTATGQKLLREMPAIVADAMTAMQPMLRRSVDKMTNDVQEQIAQMLKDSEHKAGTASQN